MEKQGRCRYIIISGSNDSYLTFLTDLLVSLNGALDEYDLGILDLGLSQASKQQIRALKPQAAIVDPGWQVEFPGYDRRPEHQKVFVAKPFIPDIFPGYEGYLWVDADIWFQDADAVGHFIAAGQQSGAAVCYEAHPALKWPQKVRKARLPSFIWLKGIRDFRFDRHRQMFGIKAALERGTSPVLTGGIFYLSSGSPGWAAWQRATKRARLDHPGLKGYLGDDSSLEAAFIEEKVPHTCMSASFHWPAGVGAALLDTEAGILRDPCYPFEPLKVIHLVHLKEGLGRVRTPAGEILEMPVKRSAFLAHLAHGRADNPVLAEPP